MPTDGSCGRAAGAEPLRRHLKSVFRKPRSRSDLSSVGHQIAGPNVEQRLPVLVAVCAHEPEDEAHHRASHSMRSLTQLLAGVFGHVDTYAH